MHLAGYFGIDAGLEKIQRRHRDGYVAVRRAAWTRGQTPSRELTTLRRGCALLGVSHPTSWPGIRKQVPDLSRAGELRSPEVLAKWFALLAERPGLMATVAVRTDLRATELRRLDCRWIEGRIVRLPAAATMTRSSRGVGLNGPDLGALGRAGKIRGDTLFACIDHKKAYRSASKKLGLDRPTTLRDLGSSYGILPLQHTGNVAAVMATMGLSDMKAAVLYQYFTLERVGATANASAAAFEKVSTVQGLIS